MTKVMIDERKCYECGKTFVAMDISQWAYRRNDRYMRYFCSYGCMRKWDKRQEEQRKKAKHDKWLAKGNEDAEREQ